MLSPKGRKFLFAALYFSEGAPIGFLWWAFPTYLRSEGVSVDTITTFTSLLAIPWSIKFIWSPFIDRCIRIKGIILTAQFVMISALIPVAILDPINQTNLLLFTLIIHAIAASTQDAAIDALCIRTTPKEEMTEINAWMQGGMLSGRALFGGGTLFLLSSADNAMAFLPLLLAIALPAVILLLTKEPEKSQVDISNALKEHESVYFQIKSIFNTSKMRKILLFALLSGAAFESVGAVAGPYLIDSGFSKEQVGGFFSLPVVGCMLTGAFLAGVLFKNILPQKALQRGLIIMVAAVLIVAVIAEFSYSNMSYLNLISLSLMYIAIGNFTTLSYSYYMSSAEKSTGATQFSALMAATNLCEIGSTMLVGRLIILTGGYPLAFLIMVFVSISALLVLPKASTSLQ